MDEPKLPRGTILTVRSALIPNNFDKKRILVTVPKGVNQPPILSDNHTISPPLDLETKN